MHTVQVHKIYLVVAVVLTTNGTEAIVIRVLLTDRPPGLIQTNCCPIHLIKPFLVKIFEEHVLENQEKNEIYKYNFKIHNIELNNPELELFSDCKEAQQKLEIGIFENQHEIFLLGLEGAHSEGTFNKEQLNKIFYICEIKDLIKNRTSFFFTYFNFLIVIDDFPSLLNDTNSSI
ncbi:hypothetical protein BpHYR1_009033 [Brachionus plicatilis]|uniref:Uncharacterized protein n=1 Tax=Brachionus plicatilis TaxID=10195 RepID=A0A3M7R3S1_BRAPC|nr:hypothetical protein BpHYR1_009033 [Brachionus plicatilis]